MSLTFAFLDTAVVEMDPPLLLQLKVKGSLALGYVALDAVVQHSLQLINSGLNTATYRIEVEAGLPLQVTPTDGKLAPTGSPESVCTLKLELAAEIAGPMSGNTQTSIILENFLWRLSGYMICGVLALHIASKILTLHIVAGTVCKIR